MKRNTLLFAWVWALTLCFGGIQAANPQMNPSKDNVYDRPHGWEEILLQGSLSYGVGPNAIEAGATEDAVYIFFNQSFGNVSIAIYNNTEGLVYSTVVDSSVQQLVVIPLVGASNGTYYVELSSVSGYAEGEFHRGL